MLADAVEGAKGLDQDKLADWLRDHTFKTVMGGYRLRRRRRNVGVMNGLEQFNTGAQPVILWPAKYKTGDALYPYDDKARK